MYSLSTPTAWRIITNRPKSKKHAQSTSKNAFTNKEQGRWNPPKRYVGVVVILWLMSIFFVKWHLQFTIARENTNFAMFEHPQNSTSILAHIKSYSEGSMTLPGTENKNTSESRFPKLYIKNTTKVIFYHVYLPSGNSSENALRIVREQIEQMGNKDVILLYNTVGDPNALPSTKMNQWCHKYNLNACFHLNHYASGLEEVSLHEVHQYCQRWPDQRVGYVHNKGSYHPSPLNEIWRHQMTEALVREECWNAEQKAKDNGGSNQFCNACGLYFTHDQGLYFAGNVWTADCRYINKLIPPEDFESHHLTVFKDALLRKEFGQFVMNAFSLEEWGIWPAGLGRYAAEWWIASHPTLQPCDFSNAVLNFLPKEITNLKSIIVGLLSWLESHESVNQDIKQELLTNKFTPQAPGLPPEALDPLYFKMREYHSLAGRIHRWLQLYSQLPPQDSWAWMSYPNGMEWKENAKKYGIKVLDKVIPMYDDPNFEKTIDDNDLPRIWTSYPNGTEWKRKAKNEKS